MSEYKDVNELIDELNDEMERLKKNVVLDKTKIQEAIKIIRCVNEEMASPIETGDGSMGALMLRYLFLGWYVNQFLE